MRNMESYEYVGFIENYNVLTFRWNRKKLQPLLIRFSVTERHDGSIGFAINSVIYERSGKHFYQYWLMPDYAELMQLVTPEEWLKCSYATGLARVTLEASSALKLRLDAEDGRWIEEPNSLTFWHTMNVIRKRYFEDLYATFADIESPVAWRLIADGMQVADAIEAAKLL
jgi:hypothetical protein